MARNVPVCAIALILAWRGMPDSRARGEQPLDVLGLALLSPALASIVYGLSEAGNQGGFDGASVFVPLVMGAALLAAFAVHAPRTMVEPIFDLRRVFAAPLPAQPSRARRTRSTPAQETPEGHAVRLDDQGRITHLTAINAKWLLDRDGEVFATLRDDRQLRLGRDDIAGLVL